MNLDHLKNTWKEEKISETPEISTQHKNELSMPLQRIRKNMRMEFWSSAFTIVLFIAAAFFIENVKLRIYLIMLLLAMALVTAFYFSRFYLLYKNLTDTSLNTKDSLKDMLFNLELNRQYYVSYYLAFVPFFVAGYILTFEYSPIYEKISATSLIVLFTGSVGLALYLVYVMGRWWFNEFYGKYISQISQLSREMGNGDIGYNFGKNIFGDYRKKSVFMKMQDFLESKIGVAGKIVNIVIWIAFLLLGFSLLGFVIGFLFAVINP